MTAIEKAECAVYNPRNGKRTEAGKTAEGTFVAPEKNDWVLLLQKAQESRQTNVK